jgi:hypothetical protein
VCAFEDCDKPADYTLTARWPDHQVWSRDVCSTHLVRGIESLVTLRDVADGKPTMTLVVLSR